MGKKTSYIIIFFLLLIFFSGCSGMSTLLDLKNEMDAQQSLLKTQKKNFQRVRLAIERNKLKKGLGADYIIGKYGEPVVTIAEKEKDRVRWSYVEDTFSLQGPRAYLYFDSENRLIDWQNLK